MKTKRSIKADLSAGIMLLALMSALSCKPLRITVGAQDSQPQAQSSNKLLTGKARPDVAGIEKCKVYENMYGYAVCDTDEEAADMFENMQKAALDYKMYFGKEANKGLLVKLTPEMDKAIPKLMEQMGCSWFCPCFASETIAKNIDEQQIREAVRTEIKAQLPMLKDDQLEEIVEQNLPAIRKQMMAQIKAISINTHEIGHMIFISSFWPALLAQQMKKPPTSEQSYGGPAADWLDETAAVLLEDVKIAKTRQDRMSTMVKDGMKDVIPLDKFLTMPHPGMTGDETKAKNSSDGVYMTATISESDKVVEFYAEVLAFAEFMIAKTGKKDIFGSIAANEAKGAKFEAWLKENAAIYGIPATIAELDKIFRDWLAHRTDPAVPQ